MHFSNQRTMLMKSVYIVSISIYTVHTSRGQRWPHIFLFLGDRLEKNWLTLPVMIMTSVTSEPTPLISTRAGLVRQRPSCWWSWTTWTLPWLRWLAVWLALCWGCGPSETTSCLFSPSVPSGTGHLRRQWTGVQQLGTGESSRSGRVSSSSRSKVGHDWWMGSVSFWWSYLAQG